jgi:hypothetical protein
MLSQGIFIFCVGIFSKNFQLILRAGSLPSNPKSIDWINFLLAFIEARWAKTDGNWTLPAFEKN